MSDQQLTDKLELAELSNKLFMYVDAQQWEKVMDEVFAEHVWFDMTSAGGEAKKLSAKQICEIWEQGFRGVDAVHHQAGHYLINSDGNNADIYAYAMATHYKMTASNGNSRMFVGSYDLKALKSVRGWRLTQFKYNLKYIDGNVTLE